MYNFFFHYNLELDSLLYSLQFITLYFILLSIIIYLKPYGLLSSLHLDL